MAAITAKKQLSLLKNVLRFFMRNTYKNEALWCVKITQNMVEFANSNMLAGVMVPDTGVPLDREVYVSYDILQSALAINAANLNVVFTEQHRIWNINGVVCDAIDKSSTAFRDADSFLQGKSFVLDVPLPPWALLDDLRLAEGCQDIRHYLNGTFFDVANRTVVCTDGHRLHSANSATLPEYRVDQLRSLVTREKDEQLDEYERRVQLLRGFIVDRTMMDLMKKMSCDSLRVTSSVEDNLRYVSGSGVLGYVTGQTINGVYPDHKRVCKTKTAIDLHDEHIRQQATPESIAQKQESHDRLSKRLEEVCLSLREMHHDDPEYFPLRAQRDELLLEVRESQRKLDNVIKNVPAVQVSKTIKLHDGAAEQLSIFVKAVKAYKPRYPGVVIDFQKKAIVSSAMSVDSWGAIPLEIPFDHLSGELPENALRVGVNAAYLADAIAAIPDGLVYIGSDLSEMAGVTIYDPSYVRCARVMSMRI